MRARRAAVRVSSYLFTCWSLACSGSTTEPVIGTGPPTAPPTSPSPTFAWIYEGPVRLEVHAGLVGMGLANAAVVVLPDGTYRLYYGSSREWPIGEPSRDNFLGSAVSSNLINWTDEGPINWTEEHLGGAWPRFVWLPDGRLRMYYSGLAAAVSTDGRTWQPETLTGLPVSTSTPEIQGEFDYMGVDVVRLGDGTYRMYYTIRTPLAGTPHGAGEVRTAISADGLNWTLEPGVRIAPDPKIEGPEGVSNADVIVLPDGTYRMFYNSIDIWSATSRDGLTWENRQMEGIWGADAHAIRKEDGTLLLYVNTIETTWRFGPERLQMLVYRWGESPVAVSATPQRRFTTSPGIEVITVKVTGTPGTQVSLSREVYRAGRLDDPNAPSAVLGRTSGVVPFETELTVGWGAPMGEFIRIWAEAGDVRTSALVVRMPYD